MTTHPIHHPKAKTHIVVQMLTARLQSTEKTLDLAIVEPEQLEALVLTASTDLDVTRDLITANLQHLSEWQVSAFHDQYKALRARLFQQVS